MEAARISLGDLQGFCNSSFGFCKGFTWIVQGCHFEFGRDFARRSLGVCSCFTWTLQGRCKDFAWSSAGILQGVSLDCAMSLLGVAKDFLRVLQGSQLVDWVCAVGGLGGARALLGVLERLCKMGALT